MTLGFVGLGLASLVLVLVAEKGRLFTGRNTAATAPAP